MMKIELLAPAKNLEYGKAAIDAGADAVYIGVSGFSARKAVGNSIAEIEALINYAHKFYAKVYVAVNTIIYENELNKVQELIHSLYKINADAIIIQDLGILKLDIPQIPIFASTQMNNYDLERIKLIDSLGIDRIILARELGIEEIKLIRENVNCELETFIYGSLCVSLSGQCYISAASCGRSANRGECAQICRHNFDLVDANGKVLEKNKYLLSLKDLNLENKIEDLIKAGVSSFKIEGRLKELEYVINSVAYFRNKIDNSIKKINNENSLQNKLDKQSNVYSKSSSGEIKLNFLPDLDRTFNRGCTNYFIENQKNNDSKINEKLTTYNTQKSIGKYIGTIENCKEKEVTIKSNEVIAPGDGLCYFDEENVLQGFRVNNVINGKIITLKQIKIKKGTKIYRNEDIDFERVLKKNNPPKRKIKIKIFVDYLTANSSTELQFKVIDEDGNQIILKENDNSLNGNWIDHKIIEKQFGKVGNTIFEIDKININPTIKIAKSIAEINQIRRNLLELLLDERIINFPKIIQKNKIINLNSKNYKINKNFSLLNIANHLSLDLYKDIILDKNLEIKYAPEVTQEFDEIPLMTSKFCIKRELNICPKYNKVENNDSLKTELFLKDNSKKYKLEFDCKECIMKIYKAQDKAK